MRRAARLTMVVLGAVLLALAAIAWYADDTLVDHQEFATRLTSSLDDGGVRRVVADQIVTGLTNRAVPDALVVRPLIVPLVAVVADTPVFRRAVRGAVVSRHRALLRGDTTFSVRLPLGDGTLFEGIRRVAPSVARRIPAGFTVPVLRLDPRGFELTAAHLLVSFAGWRWPLLVAGVLAVLGAAVLTGGVRAELIHVGLAIAGGGLLVAAIVAGLGDFVTAHAAHAANLDDDAERDAIGAVWAALFGDLRRAGLIAAFGGALVAAIGSVTLPGFDPRLGWRGVRRAATSTTPLGRGAALVVVGAALVVQPALLGRLALAVGGVLIVILGVAQLAAIRPPSAEAAPARAERTAAAVDAGDRRGARRRPHESRDRAGPAGSARRRCPRHGRAGRMQRPARDVRPAPGPGRVRRHAQLLRGRRRARVAVRQPALRDVVRIAGELNAEQP